jgi:hypothetical protein
MIARFVCLAACLALSVAVLGACSGVDEAAIVVAKCPPSDPGDFRPVSAVVEQRCATLDCHGSVARPLRIYSRFGLRRPLLPEENDAGVAFEEYFPGGDVPTTDDELQDNLRSICGLEPELMSKVIDKTLAPDELTFVRKPRLLEKHKGGLIWNKGDTGDQCITNWLLGGKNSSKCQEELNHP